MFLLLLAASQALASPVVVPGGALYSAQQSLLRGIILPYYPVYPFTNWRLITQDVVIDIDVDYNCEKEVSTLKTISNLYQKLPNRVCSSTPRTSNVYLFHRVCSSTLRIVEVTLCATTTAPD